MEFCQRIMKTIALAIDTSIKLVYMNFTCWTHNSVNAFRDVNHQLTPSIILLPNSVLRIKVTSMDTEASVSLLW